MRGPIPGTANFRWEEFSATNHAEFAARQDAALVAHKNSILLLAQRAMQPIRDWVARPIKITSGVRCSEINAAIGGSKTSQHMKGEAADFVVSGFDDAALWDLWKTICWEPKKIWGDNPPVLGQVIFEDNKPGGPGGCWIHISLGGPPWRSTVSSNEHMTWSRARGYELWDVPPPESVHDFYVGRR